MYKLITPDGRPMSCWPQVGDATYPTVDEALRAALDMAVRGAPDGQVVRAQLHTGVYWPPSREFAELWIQVVRVGAEASS